MRNMPDIRSSIAQYGYFFLNFGCNSCFSRWRKTAENSSTKMERSSNIEKSVRRLRRLSDVSSTAKELTFKL